MIVGDPFLKHERARSYGLFPVCLPGLSHSLLRQDLHAGVIEDIKKGRIWTGKMDRQVIIPLHRNMVDGRRVGHGLGHGLGPLQAEFHVAGLQFFPIMELHAFPDLKFIGFVIHHLKALRQVPHDLPVLIDLYQAVINVAVQRCRRRIHSHLGIHGPDIAGVGRNNIRPPNGRLLLPLAGFL